MLELGSSTASVVVKQPIWLGAGLEGTTEVIFEREREISRRRYAREDGLAREEKCVSEGYREVKEKWIEYRMGFKKKNCRTLFRSLDSIFFLWRLRG